MATVDLKEVFLETLYDLSLSVAFLSDKRLLDYEAEILASRCKISKREVYTTLEKAKKEKWRRK